MLVFQTGPGKNEPLRIDYNNVGFGGYTNERADEHYVFQVIVPPTSPLYKDLKEPDIKGMCSSQYNSTINNGPKMEQEATKLYNAALEYIDRRSTLPTKYELDNMDDDERKKMLTEAVNKVEGKFSKAKAEFMTQTTYATQPGTSKAISDQITSFANNHVNFIKNMNNEKYTAKNQLQTSIYVTDKTRMADAPANYKNGPSQGQTNNMVPITPQEHQKRVAPPQGQY
ncbi:MAG: hypothetical protein NTX79_05560 [Candidatus Micrarchaeota archaeon]|nr:hypothetical protein [Candidatus Micrarchaeota archaeon]